jgi:hypothetical protein
MGLPHRSNKNSEKFAAREPIAPAGSNLLPEVLESEMVAQRTVRTAGWTGAENSARWIVTRELVHLLSGSSHT